MDSVESQIMTLIHKVDILYQMIDQLNRKIALIGTENGYTNHQWIQASQFDVRISDYYTNGDMIGGCGASESLCSDGARWQGSYHRQNSPATAKSLASSLKKGDLLSPMDSSSLYLEDEICYPSSEMFDRSLIHQDILGNDHDLEDMVEGEQTEITQDIQIQRLTAQLTAAYNRIAALEEQLVAKRIHA
jgi:hypothetical protein